MKVESLFLASLTWFICKKLFQNGTNDTQKWLAPNFVQFGLTDSVHISPASGISISWKWYFRLPMWATATVTWKSLKVKLTAKKIDVLSKKTKKWLLFLNDLVWILGYFWLEMGMILRILNGKIIFLRKDCNHAGLKL